VGRMESVRGVASGRPRSAPPTILMLRPLRSLARPAATCGFAGRPRAMLAGIGLALAYRPCAGRHPHIGLALAGRLQRWTLLLVQTLLAAFRLAWRLAAETGFRTGGKLAQRLVAAAL